MKNSQFRISKHTVTLKKINCFVWTNYQTISVESSTTTTKPLMLDDDGETLLSQVGLFFVHRIRVEWYSLACVIIVDSCLIVVVAALFLFASHGASEQNVLPYSWAIWTLDYLSIDKCRVMRLGGGADCAFHVHTRTRHSDRLVSFCRALAAERRRASSSLTGARASERDVGRAWTRAAARTGGVVLTSSAADRWLALASPLSARG